MHGATLHHRHSVCGISLGCLPHTHTHASSRYKPGAGSPALISLADPLEQINLVAGFQADPWGTPSGPRGTKRQERQTQRKFHKQAGPIRVGEMGSRCCKRRKDREQLTDVERAIEIVINNFHCYAVKGRKECLTPGELKDLVGQRLPHLAKGAVMLDEKIECLGENDEAKLQFGEYWHIMGDAAKSCRMHGRKK